VVGEVTINSYAPKKFEGGADYALEMTSNALQHFNTHYAPYPYTEYDIVTISTPAYGVEYPGITAMAIRIYDLEEGTGNVPNSVYLESTLAHEFGHQYFYNLVGSDQLGEPWLDESLVQYLTWMYYKERYGAEGESGFGGSLEERWERVEKEKIPIGLPVASYEGREYGAIVYGRGAFFFEELVEVMGDTTFDEFIRDYLETFGWENATGDGFKELAEMHCDCDLTPLFEDWVYPVE
jgi:aminopeptidase N